jgi:hypothetical protein
MPRKAKEPKETLISLSKQSSTPEYIIVGALSKAGLLPQYEYEKQNNGVLDLEPSITKTEFYKLITDFIGGEE